MPGLEGWRVKRDWLAVLGLIGALTCAGVPASRSEGLAEWRQQFEATIRDAQRQNREGAAQCRQRYLSGLTALEESLQAQGNALPAVIAVRNERSRV